jgi:Tfp pilus assembly protein PilX
MKAKKPENAAPQGFTLIITISLLVLLTLVGIGLLSLSAVTLRGSAQANAQRIAKDNARMAMLIALGQLQKQTGIDQRVTATADLAAGTNGDFLATGANPTNQLSINNISNGLSRTVSGTRYWTGVFRNSNTATDIINRTPSAALVDWLVSGNETSTAAPRMTPAFAGAAVTAAGNPVNPAQAVVLAGINTVGGNPNNFVSAPTVKIAASNSAGFPGSYAWWIGDEGVKARINVPRIPTNNTVQPVAHRGGWEVNTGMETYPNPNAPTHPTLDRIQTIGSAALLDPRFKTSYGTNTTLFHTATTDSFGVLSDTQRGGLKIDLTACLERGFPAANTSTFPNRAEANRNILHANLDARFARMRGPNWQMVRDFYNLARQANEKGKLTVKAAGDSLTSSPSAVTIAPIIIDFRTVLGARLVPVPASGPAICKLNPCAKVSIAIANPYPYTLEWEQDMEVELIDETPTSNGGSTMIYGTGALTGSRFLGIKGAQPAVLNNAHFIIPKGSLPPGEARVYVQSAAVRRPPGHLAVQRVPMAPFSASNAGNFEICVELEANGGEMSFASPRQLDVRETWTTSQPTLEMRLSGGSGSAGNLLRRIERFEWDNAFHAATKLSIRNDAVVSSLNEQVKMPFPLKIYNTQISMPGMRYENAGLPDASMLGTRCSTLRTFTDFNLRAVRFPKLIASYNPPPYFFDQTDNAITDIPPTRITSSLPSQTGQAFTANLAINPLPWGNSIVNSQGNRAMLFSFPQQFVSLAQLQHVDLTGDDTHVSISQQPGNAVGNSYATPFVKRAQTIQARRNYIVSGINTNDINQSSNAIPANYYDMSYLLNVALWDTYFFSTIGGPSGSSGSSTIPSNPAITVFRQPSDMARLNDPLRASSHLLVQGSFNVHSTSKDAWKALLAATRFAPHAAGGDPSGAMFPRSMEQKSPADTVVTGKGLDSYAGFRRLTPAQIDALADQIVRQVRQRGPFLSLSHFVNRSLAPLSGNTTRTALSRSGALQSAIDLSGLNISPDGSRNIFRDINVASDRVRLQVDGSRPMADVLYPAIAGFPANQGNGTRGSTYGGTEDDGSEVWAPRSADLNPGAVASIYADRMMLTDSSLQNEQGYRSTGIPGWLTQADVLQAIGPVLSARSDTFRIRAYGEATTPDGSKVLAKAWCEAIVQRTPNYVDLTNTPDQRDISATSGPLTQLNRRFGRRYEIVNFRWLNAAEI